MWTLTAGTDVRTKCDVHVRVSVGGRPEPEPRPGGRGASGDPGKPGSEHKARPGEAGRGGPACCPGPQARRDGPWTQGLAALRPRSSLPQRPLRGSTHRTGPPRPPHLGPFPPARPGPGPGPGDPPPGGGGPARQRPATGRWRKAPGRHGSRRKPPGSPNACRSGASHAHKVAVSVRPTHRDPGSRGEAARLLRPRHPGSPRTEPAPHAPPGLPRPRVTPARGRRRCHSRRGQARRTGPDAAEGGVPSGRRAVRPRVGASHQRRSGWGPAAGGAGVGAAGEPEPGPRPAARPTAATGSGAGQWAAGAGRRAGPRYLKKRVRYIWCAS